MNEKKSSFFQQTLTAGILIGLALVIFSLIIYFLGLSMNKSVQWISYLIMGILIVYLQIQHKSKDLQGIMSYGQALGYIVMALIYAGIIDAIYTIILFNVIDTELITKIMATQEEAMTKRGMSTEQIAMATKTSMKFMPIFMPLVVLFFTIFWGTLISLITSIFTKKEANLNV